MTASNARNENVDFVKGLLIWGVIWGHTITALSAGKFDSPVWIHTFFRTYDLPLFMILSGYFFQQSYDIVPDTVHALIGYVIAPLLSVAVIMLLRQIIGLLEKSKYTSWVFGTRLEFLRKV